MIHELRAWGVIAKGLLQGKSLADITDEEAATAARLRYQNQALQAELEELRRAGR